MYVSELNYAGYTRLAELYPDMWEDLDDVTGDPYIANED